MSKHLPLDYINNHPNPEWSDVYVSCRNDVTMDRVLKYSNINWSWEILSEHQNITMETIKSHPKCPWITDNILCNQNLTISEYTEIKRDMGSFYDQINFMLMSTKKGLNCQIF